MDAKDVNAKREFWSVAKVIARARPSRHSPTTFL